MGQSSSLIEPASSTILVTVDTVRAFLFIGGTILSFTFAAGTLLGLRYDEWMGVDTKEAHYRWYVGGGYFVGGPLLLIALYLWMRVGPRDQQGMFVFCASLALWFVWGLLSLQANWATTPERQHYRQLNIPTCLAIGWVVGIAAKNATATTWERLPRQGPWNCHDNWMVFVLSSALIYGYVVTTRGLERAISKGQEGAAGPGSEAG